MPDPIRQLVSQHNQLRRMFKQIPRLETHQNAADRAYAICDLWLLHGKLEHELIYPVIEELDPDVFAKAHNAHQKADGVAERILNREYWDNFEVIHDVTILDNLVNSHNRWEEMTLFPRLNSLDNETFDWIGKKVYERHLTLLGEIPDATGGFSDLGQFPARPML